VLALSKADLTAQVQMASVNLTMYYQAIKLAL
jgi:hypothetical protein